MATLRELVCKKQPEFWKNKMWILRRDTALANNLLSVKHHLAVAGTQAPSSIWCDMSELVSTQNEGMKKNKIFNDFSKALAYIFNGNNFFCEVSSYWDPRTQAHWPIALSLLFKFIGVIEESSPFTKGHDSALPRIFYLFHIHPGKVKGLHPYLFQLRAFA